MSQIIKKFIGNNEVGAAKLRLENDSSLRARNAANSADINILKVGSANELVLQQDLVPATANTQELGDATLNFQKIHARALASNDNLVITSDNDTVVFEATAGPATLSLNQTDNAASVSIRAPSTGVSTHTMILPAAAGTNGQVLATDGSGNLSFVDSQAAEIKFKNARAATIGNITISTALNSGDVIDGVTLANGDLVLVKDQTGAEQNGIYVVGATPVRASFADTFNKHVGMVILVTEGTVNADKSFVFTADPGGTLGSTALPVSPFPTGSVNLPVWEKESFTLAGGDITNQYVDLANVAETDSIDLFVRGGGIMEEGQSYTVSYTGGAGGNTRINFAGILATGGASELIAGDVLVVKYQYL